MIQFHNKEILFLQVLFLHAVTPGVCEHLDTEGRTPALWAVTRSMWVKCSPRLLQANAGHLGVLTYLYEVLPATVVSQDYTGCTASHWAASQGHLEMVVYLHRVSSFLFLSLREREKTGEGTHDYGLHFSLH